MDCLKLLCDRGFVKATEYVYIVDNVGVNVYCAKNEKEFYMILEMFSKNEGVDIELTKNNEIALIYINNVLCGALEIEK